MKIADDGCNVSNRHLKMAYNLYSSIYNYKLTKTLNLNNILFRNNNITFYRSKQKISFVTWWSHGILRAVLDCWCHRKTAPNELCDHHVTTLLFLFASVECNVVVAK